MVVVTRLPQCRRRQSDRNVGVAVVVVVVAVVAALVVVVVVMVVADGWLRNKGLTAGRPVTGGLADYC